MIVVKGKGMRRRGVCGKGEGGTSGVRKEGGGSKDKAMEEEARKIKHRQSEQGKQ